MYLVFSGKIYTEAYSEEIGLALFGLRRQNGFGVHYCIVHDLEQDGTWPFRESCYLRVFVISG